MHVVTGDIDHELLETLLDVYVKDAGDRFRVHQEEFTIYIRLYTYFLDRYAERHNDPDMQGEFMERFLKDGLPAYHDFLDEVVGLLDRFHLTYEYVGPAGERTLNLTKGGFGCAL